MEPIDFDYRADLVAITTWTLNSYRTYDIADEFRRRGVRVILGGPHTFFHAEEAGEHCDAVGIGEAEAIWPQMLEDAIHGRLKKVYRAELLSSLAGLPVPRYDLLNMRYYRPFHDLCRCRRRGAVRSAASFVPNGCCSVTRIAAARWTRSLRRSSIAVERAYCLATAILAGNGFTRWNSWRR